jgi:hypothetical protein
METQNGQLQIFILAFCYTKQIPFTKNSFSLAARGIFACLLFTIFV